MNFGNTYKNSKKAVRILAFAAALILLFAAAATVCGAAGSSSNADTGLSCSVSLGYSRGQCYAYKWFPVYVKLKNTSDLDITGTVTVDFSFPSYVGSSSTMTASKEFTLARNSEKTVEIPLNTGNCLFTECEVTVTSSSGKKLYTSGSVSTGISTYSSHIPLLIGYMSDSGSDGDPFLKYNGQETLSTTCIITEHITPDRFPSSAAMINSFDMIFVGNIDTTASSSFTDEQLKLLYDYIDAGGTVVVGTGNAGDSCLRGFSKYFTSGLSSALTEKGEAEIKEKKADFFTDIIDSASFKSYDTMKTGSSKLYTVTDSGYSAVSAYPDSAELLYKHGTLNFFVASFSIDSSFYDAETMPYYLLSQIVHNDSNLLNRLNNSGSTVADLSNYIVTKDTKDRSPSPVMLALLMLVYIGVAIIGTYIFLRIKKKEKLMWLTVPAFAVVFSLLFILYGVIYKGGNYASTLKIVELSGTGSNRAQAQTGLFISKSGTSEVSYGYDGALYYPFGTTLYFQNGDSGVNSSYALYGENSGMVTKHSKDATVFAACEYTDTKYKTLDAEASQTDDGIVLKLTNNTGSDLSGVCASYYGLYFYIGDIIAGETVNCTLSYADQSEMEDLYYNLCYAPAGIDRSTMQNDLGNVISQKLYYSSYYYYSYYGTPKFNKLKNSDIYYRRAYFISNLAAFVSDYSDSGELLIFGFDESDESSVTLNGRKIARDFCQTVVFENIAINGSGNIPDGIIDSQVDIYADNYAMYFDAGDGIEATFVAYSGDNGAYENYMLYYITVPQFATDSVNEISFRLVAEEGTLDYFCPYIFNDGTGEFEQLKFDVDGTVTAELEYGNNVIMNTDSSGIISENSSAYLNSYSMSLKGSFISCFSGTEIWAYGDYYPGSRVFEDRNIIAILIHADAEGLTDNLSKSVSVKAPVITDISFSSGTASPEGND